ncbi:hypothetical protein [Lewinella sp. IMCC34183]|uniref:hypothetical protein n=1 Tax=Lewinella sp. IMCC34183 TaxID=2248762 RepID=UPI000E23C012|nr:hypothetical protein [Lewinella sp. IMCC34183]
MTILYRSLLLLSFCSVFTACGDADMREGEVDPAEVIDSSPDYEDDDANNNGKIDYVEQSTSDSITTLTTNYSKRADSIRATRDTLITPRYTDDEYEAAYSTSSTNPKNQGAVGITPGNNQKKQ